MIVFLFSISPVARTRSSYDRAIAHARAPSGPRSWHVIGWRRQHTGSLAPGVSQQLNRTKGTAAHHQRTEDQIKSKTNNRMPTKTKSTRRGRTTRSRTAARARTRTSAARSSNRGSRTRSRRRSRLNVSMRRSTRPSRGTGRRRKNTESEQEFNEVIYS